MENSAVLEIQENMERETGIEPATNSLEGCDSTIELLPLERGEAGFEFYCTTPARSDLDDAQISTIAALTGFDPTGISMNSGPFFQRRCSLTARATFWMRITAMSPDD